LNSKLLERPLDRAVKNVDGKTQPARGKVGLERVTFDADALDDQSGYLRVQCADQQRQQAWLGLVVDRQPEFRDVACRLEVVTLHHCLPQHVEAVPDARPESMRQRRRYHALRLPHEQRISHAFAHARKCMADRRLAQGQPVGGPCQVALAVNCRKDTKKVQIEARQAALVINLVHDSSCRLIACVIIAQALSITHSNDRRTMPWISE
jgi:hypothetical protein